jgi:hypothetical protein
MTRLQTGISVVLNLVGATELSPEHADLLHPLFKGIRDYFPRFKQLRRETAIYHDQSRL